MVLPLGMEKPQQMGWRDQQEHGGKGKMGVCGEDVSASLW